MVPDKKKNPKKFVVQGRNKL